MKGSFGNSKPNFYKKNAFHSKTSFNGRESTAKEPDFVPYSGCVGRWVPSRQLIARALPSDTTNVSHAKRLGCLPVL